MMAAAKPDARVQKRRWLLLPLAVALLLLFGHAHGLYRQYEDGRQLLRYAEPIVDELYHIHHQVMMPDAEGAVLLDDKVRRLSLLLSQFQQHISQSGMAQLATLAGDQHPDDYLETLQQLQEAELHARHSLGVFADAVGRVPAGEAGPGLQQLLQHSRLYLYTTNPLFVRGLEREAGALRQRTPSTPRLDEALYAQGIYSVNLRRLIRLRHRFADTNIAEFYDWIAGWRQRTEHSRDQLLGLALMLVLGLLCAGGGLLYLNNRKWRQASRSAGALAQAKTDFLANMSHEIRTPMNAIIGFVSLLQQTALDARQSDYLSKIQLSSDNLLLLINDILDLTKVEAGKLELEDIAFDLNEQLERLAGLFADMSEQKQLEVIINKAPNVPDRLQGDPLRLGQVLTNLVSNALKFTERGEVVLSLSVIDEAEPRLRFDVRDTGIGIVPELQEQLFQSFTQVDASTTRKYGGSGLGLSICRHLVELMGGSISVHSVPGRGSTFSVTLPLRPARDDKPDFTPVFEPGQKVLVVDDNPQALEVMSDMLRRAGFVVYTAMNIDAARALLQHRGGELALALIDCCLGRENGLDLARSIRQQAHLEALPILVVSAFGRDRPATQMRALGIEHYVSKPVTWSRLSACLARVLNPAPAAQAPVMTDTDADHYRRRLSGCHVLLAEDNRLNQQLVIEYLARVGVTVSLADNGRQAVELVSRQAFDAILMDLQMPILDGLEATRQIRRLQRHHDVPIIALTASAMRSDRESSYGSGMNAYVSKPVNRNDLYQALVEQCGRPGTERPASVPAGGEPVPPVKPDSKSAELPACRDELWLLQAAQAEGDWAEVAHLLSGLARCARADGETALAELAEGARQWPEQQQPLPYAQLALLQKGLEEAISRLESD
ncbi:response regulator [Oceanimonas sp. CHS3-5]|uniref:hybrid sensor histidine kinase/response regulator n=1 Tax=Oceanimonas sp. CHS3-5 TaxID=3068186 RepID=UPI00273FE227|nr:response regulator [Oceanimonas sp. CHS3-5]MDP5291755.1 response regulator [Oceanimonas sp. CHS3-5]